MPRQREELDIVRNLRKEVDNLKTVLAGLLGFQLLIILAGVVDWELFVASLLAGGCIVGIIALRGNSTSLEKHRPFEDHDYEDAYLKFSRKKRGHNGHHALINTDSISDDSDRFIDNWRNHGRRHRRRHDPRIRPNNYIHNMTDYYWNENDHLSNFSAPPPPPRSFWSPNSSTIRNEYWPYDRQPRRNWNRNGNNWPRREDRYYHDHLRNFHQGDRFQTQHRDHNQERPGQNLRDLHQARFNEPLSRHERLRQPERPADTEVHELPTNRSPPLVIWSGDSPRDFPNFEEHAPRFPEDTLTRNRDMDIPRMQGPVAPIPRHMPAFAPFNEVGNRTPSPSNASMWSNHGLPGRRPTPPPAPFGQERYRQPQYVIPYNHTVSLTYTRNPIANGQAQDMLEGNNVDVTWSGSSPTLVDEEEAARHPQAGATEHAPVYRAPFVEEAEEDGFLGYWL